MLNLFVYGTLKRGYGNHDRYCHGAVEIRDAEVRGRLYNGPGYPVLEVPREDVVACGTADAIADAATQRRHSGLAEQRVRPAPEGNRAGRWGAVYGEFLTFEDPGTWLPPIDRLEGFRPDGPSLYRRVLVPVTVSGRFELAWAYTLEALEIKHRRILSGRWPE